MIVRVKWHALFAWAAIATLVVSTGNENCRDSFWWGCGSNPTRELTVDYRLASPTQCFKIPIHSKPSGHGKIWEYYHFLIDFAAPMVELLRNESHDQKTVVLPGWSNDTFLQNPADPSRNMLPLAHYLFQPLNATFLNWGNLKEFVNLPCRTLNFHPGEWSGGEAETYTAFRNYAHSLVFPGPHSSIQHSNFKNDIVLIRRASVSNRTCSGSCRRHLDFSFFKDFALFMKAQNSSATYRIVETDNMTLPEQIRVFSCAKMVIGMHGGGLSNWIFSHQATIVVELGRKLKGCYETLASKLGLQYHHCPDTKFTSCLEALLGNFTSLLA